MLPKQLVMRRDGEKKQQKIKIKIAKFNTRFLWSSPRVISSSTGTLRSILKMVDLWLRPFSRKKLQISSNCLLPLGNMLKMSHPQALLCLKKLGFSDLNDIKLKEAVLKLRTADLVIQFVLVNCCIYSYTISMIYHKPKLRNIGFLVDQILF